MQFTSIYFILFFLPAVLILYHLAGRKSARAGRLILLFSSFVFCGMTNLWSLIVLIVEILFGFLFSRLLSVGEVKGKDPKPVLVLGIVLQILALGFFKYTGFVVGNVGWLLGKDLFWQDVILPLGISYTAFTQIAFLVDCYRGRISQPVNPETYALYIAFFPKLAQGPIASGTDLIRAFDEERTHGLTAEAITEGIVLFVLGLSKKVFLADLFGRVTDCGFDRIFYLSAGDAVVIILSYTFQIYFDFSGYSDMAIGVARMFGYTLPTNFNSPYLADSITDFWRRWHMSLTGFLREYLYFPLGGSRRGTVRTCLNILIVFCVSGLWHGANWTFVLWGLCHGLLQVMERLLGRVLKGIPRVIRRVFTFTAVSVLWLLFRSNTLTEFRRITWNHLILEPELSICTEFSDIFRLPGARSVTGFLGLDLSDHGLGVLSLILWMVVAFFFCFLKRNNESGPYRRSLPMLLVICGLLVLCLLSVNDVSTFIYTSF